ncbi:capsular polysaccharide export protein, LipB/KpsS family [Marinobacter guineae]|nr:capsular biosynthesis protein [Marinobacter guineae]
MAIHGIAYPVENANIIAFNPRKKRVRAILRGLANQRHLTVFESVGLDLRSAPLSEHELRSAIFSAEKRPINGLMHTAKRLFLRWQYNWCYRRLQPTRPGVVVCWNGVKGHRFLALVAAQRQCHSTLYLEEAPLPGRLTVDFSGINYGSSLPRRSDFYQRWLAGNPAIDSTAWRAMRSGLNARKTSRRQKVKRRPDDTDLSRQKFIFCPLQVPGDSQITVYGDWVKSIDDLIEHLEKAADCLPEGWHLRVKEHPSARVSFTERLSEATKHRIILDNETDTFEQVAASRAVLTVNSSVGLESFFFEKPVLVLGHAFYAFDQIATKVHSSKQLSEYLAAPEELSFDPVARDAFMSYLVEQHFPSETDIVAGKITLDNILARDRSRDELLRQLEENHHRGFS